MRSPVPARDKKIHQAAAEIIASGYRIGDRLTCRCGADRAMHRGEEHKGGHPDTGCDRFRRDPAEAFADRVLTAADSNPVHDVETVHAIGRKPRRALHASDAGACPKQVWYRVTPPEGYVPIKQHNEAATLGTIWHTAFKEARERLYPWRDYEGSITLPGLEEETSAYDSYDPIIYLLSDGKSGSEWMMRTVEYEPFPKHTKQLLVYGYALTAQGRPVVTLRVEYVHRETGKVIVHEWNYDHSAALREIGELRALAALIDSGVEPERGPEYTGPSTNVICAEYCEARNHCWNIEQAEVAGRSPESLTLLGEDPTANPQVTAWALQNYHAAKQAKNAAETAYKRAKVLLQGIPSGTYEGWSYRDETAPKRNITTWSAEARKRFLAWQGTPADDRWDLGTDLATIPMTRRREHRCTVTPPPAAFTLKAVA